MKAIKSIVLLQALLGIIAIGQQIEQGDGRKIIIVLTGQRIEEPVVSTAPQPDTSTFREKKQKKERWLQHWRTRKGDNSPNRTGGHFETNRGDRT